MSRAASSVASPPPASRAAHALAGGVNAARGTPLLLSGPAARTRSAAGGAVPPASAASSSAAAAAAAAAAAPRTAEQLDRARLDGRLGLLLSNPLSFTVGQVGPAHSSAQVHAHVLTEVAALESDDHAERMRRLRAMEGELIHDEWMYA